jgi:cobalt-precorrin-5B (C1)-methyltransferase
MSESSAKANANGTWVLHDGGPLERAAARMLPTLPEDCFVRTTDIEDAVRRAAGDGVGQLILFATADSLDRANVNAPLAEITTDMGGTPRLAAVIEPDGIRGAYERWDGAGLLGQCGRELCRRVAGDLERVAAEAVAADVSPIAAQVVLLDPAAERMVGMYGRLR